MVQGLASVLLVGYVAISVLGVGYNVAAATGVVRLPQSRNDFVDRLLKGIRGQAKPVALAFAGLPWPAQELVWPMGFRSYREFQARQSDLHFGSEKALRPEVLIVSVGNLALALVLVVVCRTTGFAWPMVVSAVALYVMAAVVLRHLSYLLNPLARQLRRSLLNPFAVFAAIALLDAGTLVCLLAVVRSRAGDARPLDNEVIQRSVNDLFNLPSTIASVTTMSPSQIAVTVVGLVFSIALARSLLQPSEFRRTPEDRAVIAEFLVNTGQDGVADKYLDGELTSAAARTKCRIRLAQGWFDDALRYSRISLERAGSDASEDAALVGMAALTNLLDGKDDPWRTSLITFAWSKTQTQGVLLILVSSVLRSAEDSATVVRDVRAAVPTATLPMVDAWLGLFTGSELWEVRALISAATPRNAMDLLTRITRIGLLTVLDPDLSVSATVTEVNAWLHVAMDHLERLARVVPAGLRMVAVEELVLMAAWLDVLGEDAEADRVDAHELATMRALSASLRRLSESTSDSAEMYARVLRIVRANVEGFLKDEDGA